MELQYSTASGSDIDTAVKSERARKVRTTARKAVTGVALLKSVTCDYVLLKIVKERFVKVKCIYHLHAVSQDQDDILANNLLGCCQEEIGQSKMEHHRRPDN
jgi:hypothetical protein